MPTSAVIFNHECKKYMHILRSSYFRVEVTDGDVPPEPHLNHRIRHLYYRSSCIHSTLFSQSYYTVALKNWYWMVAFEYEVTVC